MNPSDKSEIIQLEQFKKELMEIFEGMPVMGETDPNDRQSVRDIGQRIYDTNIPRGMKKVAEMFAQGMPQHARRLDMLWDGVGGWMG